MSKIKIIVDSTADIPQEWMEKYDVDVVSLHVNWPGGESEPDVRDPEEIRDFWKRIINARELPKTSQPSVEQFVEAYRNAKEKGYEEIIVFCISTDMSGTYNSAMVAKEEVDIPVYVVDTKKASGVNALVARRARELADAGKSAEEIVEFIQQKLERGEFAAIFYVSDFEFLRKGGRVSRFQSFVGGVLKIHVPIYIDDEKGMMIPFKRVRGEKKAQSAIVDKLKEKWGEGRKIRVLMMHVNNEEGAGKVLESLQKSFDVASHEFSMMGKVIATHVGPGTAGFGAELLE